MLHVPSLSTVASLGEKVTLNPKWLPTFLSCDSSKHSFIYLFLAFLTPGCVNITWGFKSQRGLRSSEGWEGRTQSRGRRVRGGRRGLGTREGGRWGIMGGTSQVKFAEGAPVSTVPQWGVGKVEVHSEKWRAEVL